MPHPCHHLVTAGFGPFEASSKALEKEAQGGFFHTTKAYSGQETPEWMHEEWNTQHRQEKRGFGYWFYKVMIVERALQEVAHGDTVWWVDAGCSIDPTHGQWYEWERSFKDLFKVEVPGCPERVWSKGDAFALFGIEDYESQEATTNQLAGGFFAIRKTEATVLYIARLKEELGHWEAVNDVASTTPNWEGFKENRHDQTVMSLSAKTAQKDGRLSVTTITDKHALEPSAQEPGKPYPISATRRRVKGDEKGDEKGDVKEEERKCTAYLLVGLVLLAVILVTSAASVFLQWPYTLYKGSPTTSSVSQ